MPVQGRPGRPIEEGGLCHRPAALTVGVLGRRVINLFRDSLDGIGPTGATEENDNMNRLFRDAQLGWVGVLIISMAACGAPERRRAAS